MKKLFALMFTFICGLSLVSCNEKPVPKEELKWKTAVLTATEAQGELKLKAEVDGEVGTIYYIINEIATLPTAEQIVNGVNYGDVIVAKKGSAAKTIDTVITGLTGGVEYTCHLVIKGETTFSTIQTKKAATFKETESKGTGTAEDPFKVSTVEDLEHVGMGPYDGQATDWAATAHYILTADIDLSVKYGVGKASWSPINLGNEGTFNGNNKTIKGLYINSNENMDLGLFDIINTGAKVKDLTLDTVDIITTKGFIEDIKVDGTLIQAGSKGGYAGSLAGSLKGSVENVKVYKANITSNGSRIGGLVGRAFSDVATTIKVDNVLVEANLTGKSRIGGIVGLVDCKDDNTMIMSVFNNLVFNGKITSTSDMTEIEGISYTTLGQYCGGIAGYFRASQINNAVVNAEIVGVSHIGGIVGFQQRRGTASTHPTTVSNVLFTGKVTVSIGTNCSGIVGNRSINNGGNETINKVEKAFVIDSVVLTYPGSTSDPVVPTASSAILGTSVSLEALTSAWFTENMPSLNFVSTFVIDSVTKLPTLK